MARIVEGIPTIKDLVKRLQNDFVFHFDCGFLVSYVVPSEAFFSRMIDVISQPTVLEIMQDEIFKW
ncbi:hypothetical protein [Viridibacillus soli]|uniref:hypothetical protein n=1 Tax=Viridibacillus soli TaxID=2798301 RepID=UPI0038999082